MSLEKKSQRFSELDSLRGIACLLVLISHYTWAYNHYFNTLDNQIFYFRYGDFGVQIFFILSGFVIFMTLNKVKSIKEFAVARFARLYPTYWAAMFFTITILFFFPVPGLGNYNLILILKNITMLQAFLRTEHIDQVYWSLCVEIVFYIIMGTLFYFKQLNNKYVSIAWLSLTLIVFMPDFYLKKFIVVIFILKNAPLFIAGIMFYKVKIGTAKLANHLIIILSFILYGLMFYKERIKADSDYNSDFTPLFLLIVAFVLFYVLIYFSLKSLNNKILLFFGTISYPLYLVHNVIGYSIIYRVKMVTKNQLIQFIVPTIISIILAYIITFFIEKPSIKVLKPILLKILKN